MRIEMKRADFDRLPSDEKREALKTHKLIDTLPVIEPDKYHFVLDEGGTRKIYSRAEFDALDMATKSRIGAKLKVEAADTAPAVPPESAVELNARLKAELMAEIEASIRSNWEAKQ
jgi:hypothetical protein